MAEIMRYVIKKFYPYFWRKFNFPVEDYSEPECTELVQKLREAVWVHRIVSILHWRPFLTRCIESMVSSNETYVSYVFFMVSATTNDLPNIHESFMASCSLVTGIAAYVYDRGYHEFLEYCPDILMVLFERNYSDVSGRVQIWDYLRDHLITCRYSEAYERIEEKTKGNPFSDVVNDSDFVTEIKELIKSKISVLENAAVHGFTLEVIKRSKDRTSRNRLSIEDRARTTVSTWTGSSQTEELLQNTKDYRKSQRTQRTSDLLEPRDSVEIDAKRSLNVNAASTIQPEKSLRVAETSKESKAEQSATGTETSSLNSVTLPKLRKALEDLGIVNGNGISTGVSEAIRTSPAQSVKQQLEENEKLCIYEDKKWTGELKDNGVENLEQISSTQSEKLVTRDANLLKEPESDESAHKIGVVVSERISPSGLAQSLECMDMAKMYEYENWTAGMEENESERLVTEGVEWLRKPESEQNAKKIEIIGSNRISSYKEKNMLESRQNFAVLKDNKPAGLELWHQDEKMQKTLAIGRSSIEAENAEADDLKASPHSSDEQSIQNVEWSKISTTEDASGVDIECFSSKPNLLSQTEERPSQENAGKPGIPVNKQTLNATDDTVDTNGNPISSFQLDQMLQISTNTFLKSDSELNTSVQSSNCADPEENISQFEDGFAKEDHDSSMQHATTSKRPNPDPQTDQASKRKRKKKSKAKQPLQDGKMPDSTTVKDSDPIDLTASSSLKEQSVQSMEEPTEEETSFIIPTKQQALLALLYLMQRSDEFLTDIHALLNVSKVGRILQT